MRLCPLCHLIRAPHTPSHHPQISLTTHSPNTICGRREILSPLQTRPTKSRSQAPPTSPHPRLAQILCRCRTAPPLWPLPRTQPPLRTLYTRHPRSPLPMAPYDPSVFHSAPTVHADPSLVHTTALNAYIPEGESAHGR